MGTRIRLGSGFTFGASGLRWGHSIPGLRRSYFSTGRSGTLLVGGRLRHWEPNRRPPAARGTAPRCQGVTAKGAQCTNTASMVPVDDPRPLGARGALTCVVHQSQCAALATTQEAGRTDWDAELERRRQAQGRTGLLGFAGPDPDAPRPHTTPAQWLHLFLNVAAIVLVLFVVPAVIWAAFNQQAGFHRADRAAGLAAATAAGAPGICLADNSSNVDIPAGSAGHLSWTVSNGTCDPDQMVHFVPVPSPSIATTAATIAVAPTPPVAVPGSLNPLVTQASIATTICRPGWTATVRPPVSYTNQWKATQLAASGWADQNPAHFEEDHIIPLELGGSPRAPSNLRPELWAAARVKDAEENRLHAAVCAGSMTLAAAQAEMNRFLPGATAP